MTSPLPKDSGPRSGALSSALNPPQWRRVARVNLIRREVRESLSPNALELLFSGADLVVEAGLDPNGASVYATVMVTLDLSRTGEFVREPCDAETARRLAELMDTDKQVAHRLEKLARPYLCDAAQRSVALSKIELEYRVRNEGPSVLIDADCMVSLAAPPKAARA